MPHLTSKQWDARVSIPLVLTGILSALGQIVQCWIWQKGQIEQDFEDIIGGNTVDAFDAASQAVMHHHIFTAHALPPADGRHARATAAAAVAGPLLIDMARGQADGAVVAMVSAHRQWRHHLATPQTTKGMLIQGMAGTRGIIGPRIGIIAIGS